MDSSCSTVTFEFHFSIRNVGKNILNVHAGRGFLKKKGVDGFVSDVNVEVFGIANTVLD